MKKVTLESKSILREKIMSKPINEVLPIRPDIKKRMNKFLYMDGMKLLSKLDDSSIRVCFFDPQYGIRDTSHGGKKSIHRIHTYRMKKRVALPQMTEEDIRAFMVAYYRKLINGGFMFLWVNGDSLLHRFNIWIQDLTDHIKICGVITWPKEHYGLGFMIRKQCEYLVVLRKMTKEDRWSHLFDGFDKQVWHEKVRGRRKLIHPHTKPLLLQAEVIKASTLEGDLVVDAAAGSFSVLDACRLTGRNFLGCDKIDANFNKIKFKEDK